MEPCSLHLFTLSCNLSVLSTVCVWVGVCVGGCIYVCTCQRVHVLLFCNLCSLVGPAGLSGWLCGEIGREGSCSPDMLLARSHVRSASLFIFFLPPPLKAEFISYRTMPHHTHTHYVSRFSFTNTQARGAVGALKADEQAIIHRLLCDWTGTLFNGGTVGNYQPSMCLLHFFLFSFYWWNSIKSKTADWIGYFSFFFFQRVHNCF